MMSTNNLEKLENNLSSKEAIRDFLKDNDISTPKKLIEFYVSVGVYVPSPKKRVITTVFLKTFTRFSREDIKVARESNPELVILNKLRTCKRYHDKVQKTKEFATKTSSLFTEEEIAYFKKLVAEGFSKLEIAKKLKRTYSSVDYLFRITKNK